MNVIPLYSEILAIDVRLQVIAGVRRAGSRARRFDDSVVRRVGPLLFHYSLTMGDSWPKGWRVELEFGRNSSRRVVGTSLHQWCVPFATVHNAGPRKMRQRLGAAIADAFTVWFPRGKSLKAFDDFESQGATAHWVSETVTSGAWSGLVHLSLDERHATAVLVLENGRHRREFPLFRTPAGSTAWRPLLGKLRSDTRSIWVEARPSSLFAYNSTGVHSTGRGRSVRRFRVALGDEPIPTQRWELTGRRGLPVAKTTLSFPLLSRGRKPTTPR